MWRWILACSACAAGILVAGDTSGITPRAPADYAAREKVPGMTVAAIVVPADQVRKIFSKDLTHAGYIVVEVAVFPEDGGSADIVSDEFSLRVGSDTTILPTLTARSVAAGEKPVNTSNKSKPPQLPGNVHVYNSTTVGYESGGYGRRGGVYTADSTTVAVGPPGSGPPPTQTGPLGCDPNDPRNSRTPGCSTRPMPNPNPGQGPASTKDNPRLQQDLEEKALPEGRTSQAVAGYLYFQRPSTKEPHPRYVLTWLRVGEQVRLSMPAPK